MATIKQNIAEYKREVESNERLLNDLEGVLKDTKNVDIANAAIRDKAVLTARLHAYRKMIADLELLSDSDCQGKEGVKEDTPMVSVVHLAVKGVSTTYTEMIWVDDENNPNGGYYQPVKKTFDKPRVKLCFLGKVSVPLQEGGIYTDGINKFVAITKNTIRNLETDVERFIVPESLVLFSVLGGD